MTRTCVHASRFSNTGLDYYLSISLRRLNCLVGDIAEVLREENRQRNRQRKR